MKTYSRNTNNFVCNTAHFDQNPPSPNSDMEIEIIEDDYSNFCTNNLLKLDQTHVGNQTYKINNYLNQPFPRILVKNYNDSVNSPESQNSTSEKKRSYTKITSEIKQDVITKFTVQKISQSEIARQMEISGSSVRKILMANGFIVKDAKGKAEGKKNERKNIKGKNINYETVNFKETLPNNNQQEDIDPLMIY